MLDEEAAVATAEGGGRRLPGGATSGEFVVGDVEVEALAMYHLLKPSMNRKDAKSTKDAKERGN